jgi:hypothetical protein
MSRFWFFPGGTPSHEDAPFHARTSIIPWCRSGRRRRRFRENYCTLDDILQVLDYLATRAELSFRRRASHASADKLLEELRERIRPLSEALMETEV